MWILGAVSMKRDLIFGPQHFSLYLYSLFHTFMNFLLVCIQILIHLFQLLLVMVGLSLGEQNFIKGGIAQDLRTDGRRRLTYRPIFVETGVIPQVWKANFLLCV